eukprot:429456-Rhodomonas_salina.1
MMHKGSFSDWDKPLHCWKYTPLPGTTVTLSSSCFDGLSSRDWQRAKSFSSNLKVVSLCKTIAQRRGKLVTTIKIPYDGRWLRNKGHSDSNRGLDSSHLSLHNHGSTRVHWQGSRREVEKDGPGQEFCNTQQLAKPLGQDAHVRAVSQR